MTPAHGGIEMNDSILTTTKKSLGITEECTSFDSDLILHINSVLGILTQIGVGPENGFSIQSKEETWSDFIDDADLEMVKSYVQLKTRLLFDPPLSSAVMESINKMVSELEWRIHVHIENRR